MKGRLEVMRDVVYDLVRTPRLGVMLQRQEFTSKMQEAVTSNLRSGSLQVPEGNRSRENQSIVVIRRLSAVYPAAFNSVSCLAMSF